MARLTQILSASAPPARRRMGWWLEPIRAPLGSIT
jgi:hypothetical protein